MAEQNLSDKLKDLDKIMDNFHKQLGLFEKSNIDARSFIEMSMSEIESLTSTRAAEISYAISLYSANLYRIENKYKAVIDWLDSEFERASTHSIENYQNKWAWQEKKIALIRDNEYLKIVHKRKQDIKLKLDSIRGMNFVLKDIMAGLKNIQMAKHSFERDNNLL